jgi:hypothetical protein
VAALKGNELESLLRLLDEGWKVINQHHLEKNYAFPDFKEALAFTNRVTASPRAISSSPPRPTRCSGRRVGPRTAPPTSAIALEGRRMKAEG